MFTFDDGHYRDPWYLEGNGIFVKFSVSPPTGVLTLGHNGSNLSKEDRAALGLCEDKAGQLHVD